MQTGAWTYNLTNNGGANQRVAVTVTSQASGGSDPISAQAFWGDSVINVTSGTKRQVLYASVSKGTINFDHNDFVFCGDTLRAC